jgi:16S rRNA (guanine(966)-N(2))-methyltransferase RsmD
MHIISGKFKNQKLIVPKDNITRPTSGRLRESLFNICQGYMEDALFLDLFAGSGAIGFEALSHGAKKVTFVDDAKESFKSIEANAKSFGVERQVEILYGDVFEQLLRLEKKNKQFDIIYVDPPYDAFKTLDKVPVSFSALVLKMIDEGNLLKSGGDLFIEDSLDSKPETDQLQTLKLKSSRRLGRSFLQQFTKA